MTNKNRRLTLLTSAALAVAGIVVLMIWAISLYSYGLWVDEHASVGDSRPIDYVLFAGGAALLGGSYLVLFIRRRTQRES